MDLSYRLTSIVGNMTNDSMKLYGAYLMCSGEVGRGLVAIGTSLTMDIILAAAINDVDERNLYDRVKFGLYRETFGRLDEYLSRLNFLNTQQ